MTSPIDGTSPSSLASDASNLSLASETSETNLPQDSVLINIKPVDPRGGVGKSSTLDHQSLASPSTSPVKSSPLSYAMSVFGTKSRLSRTNNGQNKKEAQPKAIPNTLNANDTNKTPLDKALELTRRWERSSPGTNKKFTEGINANAKLRDLLKTALPAENNAAYSDAINKLIQKLERSPNFVPRASKIEDLMM